MTRETIIRAWKDEDFRLSLSEAERALLPEHPAGLIELPDALLDAAAGGDGEFEYTHYSNCAGCTDPIGGVW